jgi:hypothetical protein
MGLFPSSGEEWETPTLLGPLEKPTSVTGPSEYPKMDKAQKPSNHECYTSLSQPFRIYFYSKSFSICSLRQVKLGMMIKERGR